MTSIPAIRTNLKTLPEHARGYLILEIICEADKAALDLPGIPADIDVIWLINPHSGNQKVLSDAIIRLAWLEGRPAIWAAGELSEVIKARSHLKTKSSIEKGNMYISSYWQQGMTEDKHKIAKKEKL